MFGGTYNNTLLVDNCFGRSFCFLCCVLFYDRDDDVVCVLNLKFKI